MMFQYLGALHRQVEDLRRDATADRRVTAALGLIEESLRLIEIAARSSKTFLAPNPPQWVADVIAESQRRDLEEAPKQA